MNFIDLAGSERVDVHNFTPAPLVPPVGLVRQASPFGNSNRNSVSSNMLPQSGRQTTTMMRMKEGQHINKSLFFLTQVIAMLADGNRDHIPYRNSPLTKILKTSLGGNSRTAIILCITPSIRQIEQTISTLRFGQNAKKIKCKVTANMQQNDVGAKSQML